MLYPVRKIKLFFAQGLHATPKRGEKLFFSERTRLDGNVPEYGPTGSPGVTTLTAVKPGLRSRFARRPYSSVYGAKYSYRSPTLTVNPGITRQSSCVNHAVDQLLK